MLPLIGVLYSYGHIEDFLSYYNYLFNCSTVNEVFLFLIVKT